MITLVRQLGYTTMSQGAGSSQKQVANVERRRWDTEAYEKKAKERQKRELDNETNEGAKTRTSVARDNNDEETKSEFCTAASDAAGPEGSDRAFLKARTRRVDDIDERVGSSIIMSVEEASGAKAGTLTNADVVKKTGVGWHCSVCECFLKDSHTYLDHINGRKHQRALGFSMRAVRSTEDDMTKKLEQLTKVKKQKDMDAQNEDTVLDYNILVAEKDRKEELRKEERRRKRKERKQLLKKSKEEQQQGTAQSANNNNNNESSVANKGASGDGGNDTTDGVKSNDDDGVAGGEVHPDMAAMMGFSGFG